MNRLAYDECSYRQALAQSIAPINYTLDPLKYEHTGKCRPDINIVGGTHVSHINGNLVDLENSLRGQTVPVTHCSQFKHGGAQAGKEYIKPVEHPVLDTRMRHLSQCSGKK
jgi:hypothetical protein